MLQQCVEYLRTRKIGRAKFIMLDKIGCVMNILGRLVIVCCLQSGLQQK